MGLLHLALMRNVRVDSKCDGNDMCLFWNDLNQIVDTYEELESCIASSHDVFVASLGNFSVIPISGLWCLIVYLLEVWDSIGSRLKRGVGNVMWYRPLWQEQEFDMLIWVHLSSKRFYQMQDLCIGVDECNTVIGQLSRVMFMWLAKISLSLLELHYTQILLLLGSCKWKKGSS